MEIEVGDFVYVRFPEFKIDLIVWKYDRQLICLFGAYSLK